MVVTASLIWQSDSHAAARDLEIKPKRHSFIANCRHLMWMRLARPISVLPQFPHRSFLCNFPPRRISLTRPSLLSTNLINTPTTYVHTLSRSFRMPSASPSPKGKILVLGAGNFGSCLADHLGNSEHEVFMWSREKRVIDHFNEHHKNLQYLKDHCFPPTVCAVGPDLPDAAFVKRMDVLLFAIPTQGLRYSSSRALSSVNMYDFT